MSVDPLKLNWLQEAEGQGALYLISQYWMNTKCELGSLTYTNCSHALQLGLGLPEQTPPENWLVLIWSVYASLMLGPELAMGPDSVIPGLTLGIVPSTALIVPAG